MSGWREGGGLAGGVYQSLFQPSCKLNHSESESRVLIFMTGGTICMEPSPEGLVPASAFLATHLAPRITFNSTDPEAPPPLVSYTSTGEKITTKALRTPPSRYNRRILYTVHELHPLLDSSSVSAPAWAELARLIRANYEFYDGFLILHGTDSLAYTASALSFMIRNLAKPIILTGSQAPMSQLYSDASDNLLGALVIAGHYCIPEVGLFFRQKLFRGNRATKVSADAYEAFASPNLDPLAEVLATGVRVHWDRIRHLPPTPEVSPPALKILSRLGTAQVACVRLFPGILPAMIDAVLRLPDLRGLIIECFGAGNAPIKVGDEDGGLLQVLRDATQRDNVIVGVSQCLQGSVSLAYAPARALRSAGMLPGGDMTTEAALTKLSFLLAGGDETEGVDAEDESPIEAGEDDNHLQRMESKADFHRRLHKVKELMCVSLRGEMSADPGNP